MRSRHVLEDLVASSEGVRFPRWLLALIAIAGVGLAVYALRGVLTPIFFAFLIAYLLDPLVDRFEERGLPRAVGIVILLALTLGAMTLGALVLVPMVVREVALFASELPEKLEGIRRTVEPWLASYGVEVPHSFDDLRALVEDGGEGGELAPTDLAGRAATVMGTIAGWIWGRTTSLLAVVTSLLIVPVIAFYLLHDFDRMTAGIRDLVPLRYRPFVVDVAREVDEVLGQFIRGQVLVMLALAVLYAVAYSIAGVRLAIPIGIVAGLVSFIPYVGGATALVLALLMCLLSWQGWGQIIGVVAAYTIIQVLEGFVITPRIVGDKVGLPAIWVLIALMVGGELFGFLGVLLSVPAAAVAKIFVMRLLAWYRKSHLYLHPGRPLSGMLAEEGLPDSAEMAAAKARATAGEEVDEVAPEVESVSEPVAGSESEPVAGSESVADSVSDSDSESVSDSDSVADSESVSDSVSDSDSDSDSVSDSVSDAEPESELAGMGTGTGRGTGSGQGHS